MAGRVRACHLLPNLTTRVLADATSWTSSCEVRSLRCGAAVVCRRDHRAGHRQHHARHGGATVVDCRRRAAGQRVKIKYTALLDLDTADAFDELAKVARRRTGKTVGKAEIMRALIMLAADD